MSGMQKKKDPNIQYWDTFDKDTIVQMQWSYPIWNGPFWIRKILLFFQTVKFNLALK